MTELESDSTSNIARRYRHLFRLPSAPVAVLAASVPILAAEALIRIELHQNTFKISMFAALTEVILLATIGIDYLLLRNMSNVATYRRLSAISIIANVIWLLVTLIAAIVYLVTRSEPRLEALVVLGGFFSLGFRAIVFGSVFYEKPAFGLPLAIVQPMALLFPILMLSTPGLAFSSTNFVSALAGGVVLTCAVEAYLLSVNKPIKIERYRALSLLRAFLNAWSVENPTEIEHFLDLVSGETNVTTTTIELSSKEIGGERSALLVDPGLHPGPFYPIGSSNLPADIFSKLRTERLMPLTVHSISDHDLNLPSKSEVQHYVSSFSEAIVVDHGSTMNAPVIKEKGKATATALAFGKTLLVALTQAPHGMEDFPVFVRKEIEKVSEENGFAATFVIDTHNSEGARPSEQECRDAILAASEAVSELKKRSQSAFDFSYAHTSDLSSQQNSADIGPAGAGLLVFRPCGGEQFCIAIVDANNSKLGFREPVVERFAKETGVKLLEICTSDTHVTAAKTATAKGYLALGDVISEEEFGNILVSLYEKAAPLLSAGGYRTSEIKSQVKVIGSKILNQFSGLLDETTRAAKRGAVALAVLVVVVTIIVALV